MEKFEVSLQGIFRKEYVIEARTVEEAEEKAKSLLDKDICLQGDEYVIDSITTTSGDF